MIQIKAKRTLLNSNFDVQSCDRPGLQKVDVKYNGLYYKGVVNLGESPVLLKVAYRTDFELCDHLIIDPGEGLICTFAGTGIDFATYVVFDYA